MSSGLIPRTDNARQSPGTHDEDELVPLGQVWLSAYTSRIDYGFESILHRTDISPPMGCMVYLLEWPNAGVYVRSSSK